MRGGSWSEALLIALFAAMVCFQVFVPPSLGMADNGDYARLIGRWGLGPWHPDPSDQYLYLTTEWIFDRQYYWSSDNFSSELFPISAAALAGWLFNSYHFDIRVLGAIHALLWVGSFAVFVVALRGMPGWTRWATGAAALVILTDANYVAFCNSFYMDAGAFLFLGWAVALWLLIVTRDRPTLWLFFAFAVAAAFCTLSKSQHAPLGLPLFALGVVAAFCFRERSRRIGALVLALTIPGAACAEYISMPATDARMPQYAVVFRKILERSPTPAADLAGLGLGPEYAQFIGKDRQPLSDVNADEAWWAEFLRRTGRGNVLLFHLKHPGRTTAMMWWDLKVRGADRQMHILGKYERASSYPASTQARSFGWWTALRSALIRVAPWHILVWLAAVLIVSTWVVLRERGTRAKTAALALALSIMAIMEFAISSLSDAGETERHLFLFHVLTDFTILCGVAWAAVAIRARRSSV